MVEKPFSCLDLAQLYGRPTKAIVDEPCDRDTSNFVFKCSCVAKVTISECSELRFVVKGESRLFWVLNW